MSVCMCSRAHVSMCTLFGTRWLGNGYINLDKILQPYLYMISFKSYWLWKWSVKMRWIFFFFFDVFMFLTRRICRTECPILKEYCRCICWWLISNPTTFSDHWFKLRIFRCHFLLVLLFSCDTSIIYRWILMEVFRHISTYVT